MTDADPSIGLFLRLLFNGTRFGPGKAQLLRGIRDTGSISSAGRAMGMSYKRAWELVGTLNAMFRDPLVVKSRGGPGGGGALLTSAGREVIDLYRAFERAAAAAGSEHLAALRSRRADIPGRR